MPEDSKRSGGERIPPEWLRRDGSLVFSGRDTLLITGAAAVLAVALALLLLPFLASLGALTKGLGVSVVLLAAAFTLWGAGVGTVSRRIRAAIRLLSRQHGELPWSVQKDLLLDCYQFKGFYSVPKFIAAIDSHSLDDGSALVAQLKAELLLLEKVRVRVWMILPFLLLFASMPFLEA